jgi:hypothetical protein
MEKGKSGHTQKPIMEGADVYDAIQALHNQEPHPIGMFLNDAAAILSRLADLLNPPAETDCKVRLQFSVPPAPAGTVEDGCEWEGSRSQVEEAISTRHAALLGWYLRELADLLSQLATRFAPPEGSRDWQFEFVRKGRGRRVDHSNTMFSDSNTLMKMRFATLARGKQESAIADLKPRMSRSTFFRVPDRGSGNPTPLGGWDWSASKVKWLDGSVSCRAISEGAEFT